MLPLAEASTIDDWSSTVARRGQPPDRRRGGRAADGQLLRAAIWDPVAAAFGDRGQGVLVPDGELGLLNFAALPTGTTTFLVEQGPVLVMLGQERDLVPDPSADGVRPLPAGPWRSGFQRRA